ncbi:MAG: GerMN domain-containing protein [Chloroflexota bacterium]|nr:GerMN domain-containing protein [Chloroflexota bacterium]
MSDQRQDDETLGRALGRAIESQSVKETPFSGSRLASRLDRPARGGWMGALALAAALGLFVAMGAFFVRGPFGVANPDASASPDPTARPTLDASPTAAATATTRPVEAALVYFARDLLPPVGGKVSVPGTFATISAAERVSARLRALWSAPAPSAGQANVFRPHVGGSSLANVTTTISGDTATVVIDAGTWDSLSSAETIALVQQLVYTITEEPGIRRAVLREQGKDHAIFGAGILRHAIAREDVFGYARSGAADRIESGGTVVPATLSTKVDDVQTGPGQPVRLVIDLAPRQPVAGGSWLPDFVASIRPAAATSAAKYELEVGIKGGTDTTTLDQAIEVTPLRYVATQRTGDGTTYRLGVDDARPWRVSIQPGAGGGMRLYVDIGGDPRTVNQNIAEYSPIVGQTVTGSITISGAARVYEANVSWRLRDSSGRAVASGFTTASHGTSPVWGTFQTSAQIPVGLSGRATLEVFWGSPRDGADQDVISIPLQVR